MKTNRQRTVKESKQMRRIARRDYRAREITHQERDRRLRVAQELKTEGK